ncbi:MAG: hypothetical protein ACOYL6_15760 [Bacteriovoracaceae bacterium]
MKNLTTFIFGALGIFLLKAMLIDPVIAGSPTSKMNGRSPATQERIK